MEESPIPPAPENHVKDCSMIVYVERKANPRAAESEEKIGNDDLAFPRTQMPGVWARYEDLLDKDGNKTGLGSLILLLPRSEDEAVPEIYRKMWRRAFSTGVNNFTYEWLNHFTIKLTAGVWSVEFDLEANTATGPWRKIFRDNKNGLFQIRTAYQARDLVFSLEHTRKQDMAEKAADAKPTCEKCGKVLLRCAVPAGIPINDKQTYWRCETPDCKFELFDPPIPTIRAPEYKDDYISKTDADLRTLCVERGIKALKQGMDRAEMVGLPRKYDGAPKLVGATNEV